MRTVLSRLTRITARRASRGMVHGAPCTVHGAGGLRTLHAVWPVIAAACLASVFGVQAAARSGAGADVARLESIAGQFDRQSGSILIQTSEPVPYVTADPDPMTVLVELRNVTSKGVANRLAARAWDGLSMVTVEDSTGFDGAPVARVRVNLARPLSHRVRSTRNVIRVELDAQTQTAFADDAGRQPSAARKPASVLSSVRAMHGPSGPIVVLQGNGALTPASVELTREQPYRLVLDFAGVSPSVKATTPVATDPVDRVRVARHSASPLVTRVVVDLKRSVPYRIDDSQGSLAIVFGAPAEAAPAVVEAANANTVKTTDAKPLPSQPVPVQPPASPQAPAQDTTDLLRRLRALQAQAPAAGQSPGAQAAAPPPQTVTTPAEPPATAAPQPAPVPPAPPAAASPQVAATPPAAAENPAAARVQVRDLPPSQAAAAQQVAAPPAVPAAPQAPPVGQPHATPPAAPPAVPTAMQELQAQQAQTTQRKYSGAPISLDFAGSDIRQVLRVFSDSSGLNIIIDPKVQGTVDISMRDVPWDQAMEIILRSAGLGYALDGNVVRIAPLTALAEEEKQRRALEEEKALAGTLETLTRTLSYATAKDISGVLKSSLTKRGQVEIDERSNTLIIHDLPIALPGIAQIIDTLDRAQPQVEIEARIVQTTRTFARQLGIKWGFMGQASQALGNATGLVFPNTAAVGGRTGATSGSGVEPLVNLRTTAPAASAVGLSLGAVNGAFNLDIELSALESQGKGRILSTPRVLALNNVAAEMMQGVQIPIQVVANNTVTVSFKDAALKLLVTPQVTANQTVFMNIELENATPDYTKSVNNIPPINTQRAKTQVLTNDNQTIVIGGVFVSQEQAQNDHTPGLSNIPLLGWLFRRDMIDDESRELLIFLTPRIVSTAVK